MTIPDGPLIAGLPIDMHNWPTSTTVELAELLDQRVDDQTYQGLLNDLQVIYQHFEIKRRYADRSATVNIGRPRDMYLVDARSYKEICTLLHVIWSQGNALN